MHYKDLNVRKYARTCDKKSNRSSFASRRHDDWNLSNVLRI